MQKKRSFMFATLLMLVVFLFIQFVYKFKAGWRLSVGIDYIIYANDFAYVYGIVETVIGGVRVSAGILFTLLSLIAIVVGFLFYARSGKSKRALKAGLIVVAISTVVTSASFVITVGLEGVAGLVDLIMYILASEEGGFSFYGYSGYPYYSGNEVPESILILNAVDGGLTMCANFLFVFAGIIPFIPLVLGFKAKVEVPAEEPAPVNEAPVEEQQEEPQVEEVPAKE